MAPRTAPERELAAWLGTRYGRVSNERVLSGTGLACIAAALRGLPADGKAPLQSAADVVAAALQGDDPVAHRALALFCTIYGAVAGDAALFHGAATVLIAGGMVLHFLDFLRASDFLEAFRAKGRHCGYMERMDVHVVRHANPGLLGAAAAALRFADTAR